MYNTLPGSPGCQFWEEYFNWNASIKADIMKYSQANMDALQNWFFWTWKIGNSTALGYPPSPFWHYKLGVEQGWMPTDPRVAGGYCAGVGKAGSQVSLQFLASNNAKWSR